MITYAVSDKWAEGGCTIVHTHRARGAGGGGTRKSRQHMRRLGSLGRASERFQLFSTLTLPVPGCGCTAERFIGSSVGLSEEVFEKPKEGVDLIVSKTGGFKTKGHKHTDDLCNGRRARELYSNSYGMCLRINRFLYAST